MISRFLSIERVITRAVLCVAILLLAVTATLVMYQVIMRFVVGEPSTWSAVASRTAMIWCVFLGLAAAFRTQSMLRVEIIYSLAPQRFHLLVDTIIYLLCLTFFVLLIYLGTQMGYRVRNQTLAGMDISIAWAYAALPVGSFFAILASTGAFLERFTGDTSTPQDGTKPEESMQ
ncbi:MAG: TRAP transporter small permease [Ectothiorhodospiraceae bacterium]|nr:TRAP transporter small permease [Ectothiorhodospiraceae bacterium]